MAIKTATKTAEKDKCAVALGRKGGKAAVSKKAGIHSPAYKKKHKAKAKPAPKKKAVKKAAPKRKTPAAKKK